MTKTQQTIGISILALAAFTVTAAPASAQVTQRTGVPAGLENKMPTPPPPTPLPSFTIGADDVLLITVWGEKDLTGDVKVRPDGKITLPVGNDIVAVGLTTEELKVKVVAELKRFFEAEPTVFVQVKEINSRMVGITGAVNKPGRYPLIGPMTVLQLIVTAGGLQEFADKKNLMLVSATLKRPDGQPFSYKINYSDLEQGKNLAKYNIELRPGDTLIVK